MAQDQHRSHQTSGAADQKIIVRMTKIRDLGNYREARHLRNENTA